jgi:hypothetical protein
MFFSLGGRLIVSSLPKTITEQPLLFRHVTFSLNISYFIFNNIIFLLRYFPVKKPRIQFLPYVYHASSAVPKIPPDHVCCDRILITTSLHVIRCRAISSTLGFISTQGISSRLGCISSTFMKVSRPHYIISHCARHPNHTRQGWQ